MKIGAKLGILFTVGKLIALLVIIITGIVYMALGHTNSFKDPWKNTTTSPGKVAMATLNAYFAYKGCKQASSTLGPNYCELLRKIALGLLMSVENF